MRKNNREKIIKTARLLFPKYGYNGISIRAIASKAKLTTGAIYFHFKNKKDIYKTICFEAIDILIDKFKGGSKSEKTPLQKLISTFDSYIDFFYRHRDHYNILMEFKAAYESGRNTTKNEIAHRMLELIDLMSELIDVCIDEGYLRKVDSKKLSFLFASIAEGMLQYKKLGLMDSMEISDSEFREFMIETIWRGIQIRA
jgi:AcrR family transcriptional regulator